MKNLKLIIAIVVISISSVVSVAANTEPTEAKSDLRAQIVTLLGNHNYDLGSETLTAEISVMLNNKGELIVISVKTDDEQVESFVKSRLNYKKVSVKEIKKGTVYRVLLKLK